MSQKRPGTVDYSHFDNIDCSSSSSNEDGDDEVGDFTRFAFHGLREQRNRDADSNDESEDEDDTENGEDEDDDDDDSGADGDHVLQEPNKRMRLCNQNPPSLAELQRAWNTTPGSANNTAPSTSAATATTASGSIQPLSRQCAHCSAPNARFRCSRCSIARYCNQTCQIANYSIHKLECVDASKHFAFWGVFNNNSSVTNNDKTSKERQQEARQAKLVALQSRQMAMRRRALQRALAAAAIERARLAREARGTGGKGEGGNDKGKQHHEQREETCVICHCEFTVAGDSGVGLCCPASHHMCSECTGVYVNSVMGDLETSYPPSCPECKLGFGGQLFERQLSSSQQSIFKAFAARKALKPYQKLVECNHCGFFEVLDKESANILWWCGHCGKGVCFVCKKDLPVGVRKYDITKSPHAICAEFGTVKALVEDAIEKGSKQQCPGCGLSGRKDDACTHMTCAKCATIWCYVCGKDVKHCDKAPPRAGQPADDIYLHNRDWETNENRCPMYMTQILEVDLSWLGENWQEHADDDTYEDDERCLDYFHRFQTIRELQIVRAKVGDASFEAVFHNFESVKNSGYGLEEVIATSTDTLIDRREYLESRDEMDRMGHDSEEEGDDDDEGEGEINGDDEAAFEEVPREMTLATQEEEEQMRRAIANSRHDTELQQRSRGGETIDSDDRDNTDDDEEIWETVPPAMTHAVTQEQQHVDQALESSRASNEEDEGLRHALAVSVSSYREDIEMRAAMEASLVSKSTD